MKKYILILLVAIISGCTADTEPFVDTKDDEEVAEDDGSENEVDNPDVDNNDGGEESGESENESDIYAGDIVTYVSEKTQDGYVLVNDASNNRVYLMSKTDAKILYEWDLPSGIGNDAELLDNGNLLVALTDSDPAYTFGGYGGRMAMVAPSGDLLWDYEYSDELNLAHHDLEILPNGNVLVLAWEKKEGNELNENGYYGEDDVIYIEKVFEIDRRTNQIVWEWSSWDHLVQDVNSDSKNFGVVKENTDKININYMDQYKEGSYNGDIMHANALEYDKENDLIYISVNFFSEVWVIDHSTTTAQAKTGAGGNFNKGGDILFRFGNPEAYNDFSNPRLFFHNHNPTLVPGTNRILVYSNGLPVVDPHSTVYELILPEINELGTKANFNPEIYWSFADPDLFSAKVSGAHRLPNGNTLITEGTYGYWEVTPQKEVVWKFEGDGFFWRGYHYDLNSFATDNLNL